MHRRAFLQMLAAGSVALLAPTRLRAQSGGLLQKAIPATGANVPVIGLGSWITFNVGRDTRALERRAQVMQAFFEAGGQMIDSSPMYGSSQNTIGYGLEKLGAPTGLFAADKVWTNGAGRGRAQIEESRENWGVPRFALLMVHNLRDWQAHLPTLFALKAAGELDYVGVSTSHGRRHGELAQIFSTQPVDFVQLTYNITHRSVEDRLLPLAKERGVAVIANRPFDGGRLVRALKRRPLPSWAVAAGFSGWPDFLLKYIVSHPAVTCAIPATSRVDHVRENMLACRGTLPDASLRARMAEYVAAL